MFNKLFIVTLLFFITGCSQEIKDKKSLMAYLANPVNGLTIVKESGGVECKISYVPWQVQVYNDQFDQTKLSREKLEGIKSKCSLMLSLSKNNKEILKSMTFGDYSNMLSTFSFRMQEFVSARVDNGKLLTPVSCTFQQSYGMSKSNSILLVFEAAGISSGDILSVFIKECGLGIGDIQYSFRVKDINKVQNYIHKIKL